MVAIDAGPVDGRGRLWRMRDFLDDLRTLGFPEHRIAGTTAGTPEQILERAHAFKAAGIEGLTFSMGDVHDLEAVALAGETLAPVFAR